MNALMEVPTVEQNPDIPYLGKLLGDAIREHDCDVLSIAPKLYGPRRSIGIEVLPISMIWSPSWKRSRRTVPPWRLFAASCFSRFSPASIWLRLLYIEPPKLLQVQLLKRYRAGVGCTDPRGHSSVDQRDRDRLSQLGLMS